MTLDTTRATLTFHTRRNHRRSIERARAQSHPTNGRLPTAGRRRSPGLRIRPASACKNGFDPARLYELVYTAKDPLVLGIGFAATRDIVDFFRHAAADANGTANPVAGRITHGVALGDVAVRQFPQDVRAPRLQRGRGGRVRCGTASCPYIAGRQLR